MKQSKILQLVNEFPFLSTIISEWNLRIDLIDSIVVRRGDLNLLEVTPNAWAYDFGGYGNDEGYRHFWIVSDKEEITRLESSWSRCIIPHDAEPFETAKPIGSQIRNLDGQVSFIVEVNQPGHDTSSYFDEAPPCVVIYKMKGFNWRNYHQPVAAA